MDDIWTVQQVARRWHCDDDVLRGPQTGNAVFWVADPDPTAFPWVPRLVGDDGVDEDLAALSGGKQRFAVRATAGSARTFRGDDDVTTFQGFPGLALA